MCFATGSRAQLGNFGNRVKNKIDQKVNQRADAKADKAIDNTLDKMEGKETAGHQSPAVTEKNVAKTESNTVKSFSRYDFIAGEKIVYYDNFESESIAELPTGWNTNGSGEVVTLENLPGKWLQLHKGFTYLSSNEKLFGLNYTVEFDVLMNLKNNGWMFPTFSFGLFASNDEPATGNVFLKEYNKNAAILTTIFPGTYNSSKAQVESVVDNKPYFKSELKDYKELEQYYGKPVHIAIQVQQQRYRVWINETKAFDVPKGIDTTNKMNQLLFKVSSTNYSEEQYGMFVSNIKVAQGVADTRHKLVEEGKFSTTAILFDVNEATIKPESGGVLKEIAAVLNEHKEIKISIVGHTDSDGADAANLTLSQKRAAAVKEALVNNYGIDEARIVSSGKGESVPVSDNKTKESKAANRRVEFIKQ